MHYWGGEQEKKDIYTSWVQGTEAKFEGWGRTHAILGNKKSIRKQIFGFWGIGEHAYLYFKVTGTPDPSHHHGRATYRKLMKF